MDAARSSFKCLVDSIMYLVLSLTLRVFLGAWILTSACSSAAAAAAQPRVAIAIPGRRKYTRVSLEMDDTAVDKTEAFVTRLNDSRYGTNSKIQLDDGDLVTCVSIKDQLSLIHLSDPEVQLKPSATPRESHPRSTAYPGIQDAAQSYHVHGVVCPPGTYPFRAPRGPNSLPITLAHEHFDRPSNGLRVDTSNFVHEHAVAYLEGAFKGTDLRLNVWKPYVDKQAEFSLAQVWVVAVDNSTTNSVEAGWQVYEAQYGDTKPRLFTYWTADNYENTGCYNLDCPGFVQVSNKVMLGGAFESVSTNDRVQYEMRLQIFQDPSTHNWWLEVNNEHVGYWPSTLFTNSLRDTGSTVIQWGGEVLGYQQDPESHSNTTMGSGLFPDAGFRRAAYLRQVKYVSSHNELRDATVLSAGAEAPNCYSSDAKLYYGVGGLAETPQFKTHMTFWRSWGVHFFYGGPGRSTVC